MKKIIGAIAFIISAVFAGKLPAQGTAFTYQGRLQNNGAPANGIYDLQFTIYAAPDLNTALAGPVTNAAVAVSNGLFMTTLDFGNVFTGGSNWLEIAVSPGGSNSFATLTPRQQLTAVPYAQYAPNAGAAASAGSVAAANITGTIPLAQLPENVVTNGASGVNITGTFSGNGAGVTNVPMSNLVRVQTSVFDWGDNYFGETNIPAGLDNVTSIAAGGSHCVVLKNDGTVTVWGDNFYGQRNVPAGLSNVVAVAAGGFHSLALKSDGTVVAWGVNGGGQSTVPAGLKDVVSIAGGGFHSLAARRDGTVVAWGYDNAGQASTPAGLSNVVAVAAGSAFSLALKSDGTVVAWGDNYNGQLNIPAGLSNVVAIAAGGDHSLALKSDGTVVAWGYNFYGESAVPAGLSNVVAVAAGVFHSLALKSDGTVVGWGDNYYGQTTIPAGLSNVVAISGGDKHSMALRRQIYPASLARLDGSNVFQGTISATGFGGDGSGLTNLTGVALLKGGNTFAGNQVITNGSVGVGTVTPGYPLNFANILGDKISLWGVSGPHYGFGVQNFTLQIHSDVAGSDIVFGYGQSTNLTETVRFKGNGNVGIGNNNPTNKLMVVNARCDGSSWINASDRNLKQDFAPVDAQVVLEKVAALPIQSWSYKAQPEQKHMGPVAQDFRAAFGLGQDERSIATVDEGGVALAAIQGLNQKLQAKDAEIAELKAALSELKQQVQELKGKK
jgi:Regulator of chromosome condensation (RCC1) repeat/Chaperone of endosialidase